MRVSNIGKRKKTLKNFQVPSFCLTFRHFLSCLLHTTHFILDLQKYIRITIVHCEVNLVGDRQHMTQLVSERHNCITIPIVQGGGNMVGDKQPMTQLVSDRHNQIIILLFQ